MTLARMSMPEELIRAHRHAVLCEGFGPYAKDLDVNPNSNYNLNCASQSLWGLDARCGLRRACIAIISHPAFDAIIIVCILLNSVMLAMDHNRDHNGDTLEKIMWISENTFFPIFATEALIKIVALGFVIHKGSYLRSYWNVLDFVVVLIGVINVFIGRGSGITLLRALRVLRPLRITSKLPKLRVLIKTLAQSLPLVMDVFMLLSIVVWTFAILGMQLWSGHTYSHCHISVGTRIDQLLQENFTADETANIAPFLDTKGVSVKAPFRVQNDTLICGGGRSCSENGVLLPQACIKAEEQYLGTFDNVLEALLLVLKGAGLDDWPTDMGHYQNASGHHAWVFWFFLTMIGNYFVFNLVLAVLSTEFAEERARAIPKPPPRLLWLRCHHSLGALVTLHLESIACGGMGPVDGSDFQDDTDRPSLVPIGRWQKGNWVLVDRGAEVGIVVHEDMVDIDEEDTDSDFDLSDGHLFEESLSSPSSEPQENDMPQVHEDEGRLHEYAERRWRLRHGLQHWSRGLQQFSRDLRNATEDSVLVTVINGDSLIRADKLSSDPYCIVTVYLGKTKATPRKTERTSTIQDTCNPHWNERLEYSAPRAITDGVLDMVVECVVMDHDDTSQDDFMGWCQFRIKAHLSPDQSEKVFDPMTLPLGPRPGNPDDATKAQVLRSQFDGLGDCWGALTVQIAVHDQEDELGETCRAVRRASTWRRASRGGQQEGELGETCRAVRRGSTTSWRRGSVRRGSISRCPEPFSEHPKPLRFGKDTEVEPEVRESISLPRQRRNMLDGYTSLEAAGAKFCVAKNFDLKASEVVVLDRRRLCLIGVTCTIYFQVTFILFTVLNVLVLAMERYPESESETRVTYWINFACSIAFAVEAALKIGATSFRVGEEKRCVSLYFKDGWNVFEFILVLISVPDFFPRGPGQNLNALRVFRVLRAFRLLKRIPTLQRVLATVLGSVKDVSWLSVLILIYLFLYSVLGMHLFGTRFEHSDPADWDPSLPEPYRRLEMRFSFATFVESCFSVFVIMTGEKWGEMMFATMERHSVFSFIYFVTAFLLGHVILLNLFVAIIVDKANQTDVFYDRKEQLAALEQGADEDFIPEGQRVALELDRLTLEANAANLRNVCGNDKGQYLASECGMGNFFQTRRVTDAIKRRRIIDDDPGLQEPRTPLRRFSPENLRTANLASRLAASQPSTPEEKEEPGSLRMGGNMDELSNARRHSGWGEFDQEEHALNAQHEHVRQKIEDVRQRMMNIEKDLAISEKKEQSVNVALLIGFGEWSRNRLLDKRSAVGSYTFERRDVLKSEVYQLWRPPLKLADFGPRSRSLFDYMTTQCVKLFNCAGTEPAYKERRNWKPSGDNWGDALSGTLEEWKATCWRENWGGFLVKGSEAVPWTGPPESVWNAIDSEREVVLYEVDKELEHVVVPIQPGLRVRAVPCPAPGVRGMALDRHPGTIVDVSDTHVRLRWDEAPPGLEQVTDEPRDGWWNDGRANALSGDLAEDIQKSEATVFFYAANDPNLEGHALKCFSTKNAFRRVLYRICENRQFQTFVTFLIFANMVFIAIDTPEARDNNPSLVDAVFVADIVFAGLFLLECAMKIVAYGFCGTRGYCSSRWNVIDLVVAVCAAVGLFFPWLKMFRSLRTIRLVVRLVEVRLIVEWTMVSLPRVADAILLMALFIMIWAILGVSLFRGAYGSCSNPQVLKEEDCKGFYNHTGETAFGRVTEWSEMKWEALPYDFDNVGSGSLTLFMMALGDGWQDVMYSGIDASGIDAEPGFRRGPVYNYSQEKSLYFITFMVIGRFFLMSLFVGVLISVFVSTKERETGRVGLLMEQEGWIHAQRMLLQTPLEPTIIPPTNPFRFQLYRVAISDQLDTVTTVAIVLNAALLSTSHYNEPTVLTEYLHAANIFFVLLFTVESLVKIVGLSPSSYFMENWNRFDFLVVVISLIALGATDASGLSALRLFRIARVIRLLERCKGLRTLVRTLLYSLPQIWNIFLLLFVLFFMFGVAGVELFGRVNTDVATGALLTRHMNFRNTYHALITLYTIASTEAWYDVMRGTSLDPPRCDPNLEPHHNCGADKWISLVFFLLFMVLGSCLILNLFVTVVVDRYAEAREAQRQLDKIEALRPFIESWRQSDINATGMLEATRAIELLQSLPGSLFGPRSTRERPHGSQWIDTLRRLERLCVPVGITPVKNDFGKRIGNYRCVRYNDIISCLAVDVYGLDRLGRKKYQLAIVRKPELRAEIGHGFDPSNPTSRNLVHPMCAAFAVGKMASWIIRGPHKFYEVYHMMAADMIIRGMRLVWATKRERLLSTVISLKEDRERLLVDFFETQHEEAVLMDMVRERRQAAATDSMIPPMDPTDTFRSPRAAKSFFLGRRALSGERSSPVAGDSMIKDDGDRRRGSSTHFDFGTRVLSQLCSQRHRGVSAPPAAVQIRTPEKEEPILRDLPMLPTCTPESRSQPNPLGVITPPPPSTTECDLEASPMAEPPGTMSESKSPSVTCSEHRGLADD
eukprot:Hpha_TRINITY_DN15829_c1_g11::TRINITY_DN15829_c1_g11_i1::g.191195::m.191195